MCTSLQPVYKALRESSHTESNLPSKHEDLVYRLNVTEVATQKRVHSAHGKIVSLVSETLAYFSDGSTF